MNDAQMNLLSRTEQCQFGGQTIPLRHVSSNLIHRLFEEQAQHTPNALAVLHGKQQLSYAQLDRNANRLARYLRHKGVGPDQLVGICLERSPEMIIALLAVLKAGGAYIPLDPSYPYDRIQYMLADASPRVVLTTESARVLPAAVAGDLISFEAAWGASSAYSADDLAGASLESTPANLVYVIYTSGSTGQPKGTAMSHGAMANLLEWHREAMQTSVGTRVLQFAALSFDVSFQEIFSTLTTGGTLVLLDEWVRRDARALISLLNRERIERLFVPPRMLQGLAERFTVRGEVALTLRDVITAGEQLRITPEIVSLFERLDGCRLHNHYGPTETHVVTALTLGDTPSQWPTLPTIGAPISNTEIYILDDGRQPVPLGEIGEIYIGGANLARGYLNRADLTAERFVYATVESGRPVRIYRTGDLGRWQPDGSLEYLGRNDDQVKIRGYRIELGEIEAQLELNEYIKTAAVVAREDIPGDKRLVAYFIPRDGAFADLDRLRRDLLAALPDHMVPGAFVAIEHFPLTPSGKLDRRALPRPEVSISQRHPYEAPNGALEEVLAQIWQELLGLPRVGRLDNFFELGGNSFHGMTLVARMERELSVLLPAVAVFQYPTIRDLAEVVELMRCLGTGADGPCTTAAADDDLEEGVIAATAQCATSRSAAALEGQ